MLGTEYNWLVTLSPSTNEIPRVRLAGTGIITLWVAAFCLLAVALNAEPTHVGLMREAAAAREAGDAKTLIAKLESARALRPDYPRILSNLARAYAADGQFDAAIAQLTRVADTGLFLDIAHDKALRPLQVRPEFTSLVQKFTANKSAIIGAEKDEAFPTLPSVDGILESIAVHPKTQDRYFGDVRNRCIWIRPVSAKLDDALIRFSNASYELLGVFALKIEAKTNTLWASCSAVPEMTGYTEADKGRAFLVAYDLATQKLSARYEITDKTSEHVLGDFAIGTDGTIYATDSSAPIIWRLAPGAKTLEAWLTNSDFVSLQGIALSADERMLRVSDYANGLWQIDLTTRAIRLAATPPEATLFGLDGIYAARNGSLIAVQNGVVPQRILKIDFSTADEVSRVTVLRAGHSAMTDLSLGQIVDDHFEFIADSGWNLFSEPAAKPAARTATLLSIKL